MWLRSSSGETAAGIEVLLACILCNAQTGLGEGRAGMACKWNQSPFKASSWIHAGCCLGFHYEGPLVAF